MILNYARSWTLFIPARMSTGFITLLKCLCWGIIVWVAFTSNVVNLDTFYQIGLVADNQVLEAFSVRSVRPLNVFHCMLRIARRIHFITFFNNKRILKHARVSTLYTFRYLFSKVLAIFWRIIIHRVQIA